MRKYPKSAEDFKELERLNAEDWMTEALKKNPDYVWWGCYEDYMCTKEGGWNSRVIAENIEEGLWELDDYNELVHFYFEVSRESESCTSCDSSGLNPETRKLADDWYSSDRTRWVYTDSGKRYNDLAWSNHLTDVEVEELAKAGRLNRFFDERYSYDDEKNRWMKWVNGEKVKCEAPVMPSPKDVNNYFRNETFGHDAINRMIAVRARAKSLGVYGECEECSGSGYIFTEEKAKLSLQLWVLHPRKGAARGVYIKEIKEEELPVVIAHLKKARDRNQERFSKL